MFDSIDQPPAWAFSWCYVYFFATVIAVGLLIVSAIMNLKKLNGLMILALVFSVAVQFAHGMTYFWMCRASLRSASGEGFKEMMPQIPGGVAISQMYSNDLQKQRMAKGFFPAN